MTAIDVIGVLLITHEQLPQSNHETEIISIAIKMIRYCCFFRSEKWIFCQESEQKLLVCFYNNNTIYQFMSNEFWSKSWYKIFGKDDWKLTFHICQCQTRKQCHLEDCKNECICKRLHYFKNKLEEKLLDLL